MGCGVDKYQCYCTKREFRNGLKTCSAACGEEVDIEITEWRNIFCRKLKALNLINLRRIAKLVNSSWCWCSASKYCS
jgi:hypothetical protein